LVVLQGRIAGRSGAPARVGRTLSRKSPVFIRTGMIAGDKLMADETSRDGKLHSLSHYPTNPAVQVHRIFPKGGSARPLRPKLRKMS
jgi:hypothetical protein